MFHERILASSVFPPAETERIYHKYFTAPSRTVQVLLNRYHLGDKRVLVLGCAYGYELIHFGAGSVGLDYNPRFCEFGQSIGLDIRLADLEAAMPAFDEPFDGVLCSNLLEHVMSPHVFLARLRGVLKPQGQVFIKVPLTPPAWIHWLYGRLKIDHGFDHDDHINFFTPNTLHWTLAWAGYRVVGEHSPLLANYPALETLRRFFPLLVPSTVTAAQPDPHFKPVERRIPFYTLGKSES